MTVGPGRRARVPLLVITLSFALAGFSRSPPADKPLVRPRPPVPFDGDFADPFVLRAAGGYYAFATGARGSHLQLATSPDLVGWKPAGDPLPALPVWAAPGPGLTWAPAVLARDKSYVLYYTTRDLASGFQCISRATAERPEGPYVDASLQPFICQTSGAAALCGSIDPSPFLDRDGTPYLLWKSDENSAACRTAPRIWAQRLSADGLGLVGAASPLIARDRDWEGDIVEAPSMIRRGDAYYLFYSGNWYASSAYAIGYAVCASPTSGCRKVTAGAPLLASACPVLGPGGQELFTDGEGAVWMAYHAWTAPHTSYETGGARRLHLARVDFNAEGQPLASAR